MSKKQGASRKAESDLKSSVTQIRLLAAEKAGFEEAAELSGLSLSAWMRERLRLIAKKELEQHGKTPPFLGK